MRSTFVAAGSILLVTLGLLLPAPFAFGQGANATITGTITDPTGLPVAAANVEAKNIETGLLIRGGTAPVRAAEHVDALRSSGYLIRLN